MLDRIAHQAERIALALVSTDKDDLPSLAKVHDALAELERLGEEATRNDIASSAATIARAVEAIVLSQVDDAEAALRGVASSISDLQRLVDGGAADPGEPADPGEHAEPADSAGAAAAAVEGESFASSPIPEGDLQLVSDFISEAVAHLESAEAGLLAVEQAPEDIDSINAVFRAFHTIKGVAGFLDRRQIGSLAHAAESLLDAARQKKLELTGGTLDVVLESLDTMRVLIASLSEAVKTGRAEPAQPGLKALIDRLHAVLAPGGLGAARAAAPGRAGADVGAGDQPAVEPASSQAVEAAAEPASEPASERSGERAAETASPRAAGDSDSSVKVGTARLDSLVNMVGELLIAQAMVQQGAGEYSSRNQGLARSLRHMGKIARELQDLSMSMRMVPIQGVFQKMVRLARDVGRKAGKQVELVCIGGETELDRNVVEVVSDPLVHMVRNAIDHGLETPDERAQLDKPAAGRVELRAFHHSGNIVIRISDDGRGLNRDRILRKAVQTGIVGPEQSLSDQEVYALIFHAGLSTAEKVTDVSGRGVGMDVVRKNIEALHGRIEIASRPGEGSTFTIRLPITLAMIDGMVVRVGGSRFIIPTTSIEQSLQPAAEQLSSIQGRARMCMVRGCPLPLYKLAQLFGMSQSEGGAGQGLTVILQDGDRRCCMVVDELLGQQQVVIKSLGDTIGKVRGVSGGAILGDGTVSLILDVPGLIDLAQASAA